MSIANAKWRKAVKTIKYVYTPLIFICISYFSLKNYELLVALFSKANLAFLISAVLLWTSLHLLAPISAKIILRFLGYPLSYKKLLTIYATRLPARYIPGGIWHTVGRLADYLSCGITQKDLSIFVFFETLLPIPVTFFIGGVLLLLSSQGILSDVLKMATTVTSFFLLLVPLFLLIWKPFEKYRSVSNVYLYLSLLIHSLFFWLLAATSFILYFQSVSLQDHCGQSFFSLAGAYVFSWGAGYISIFAPQGIGVFEVVAGKLIDMPLSLGSSVAFLSGFRLIVLVADILIYLSFSINKFVSKRKFC